MRPATVAAGVLACAAAAMAAAALAAGGDGDERAASAPAAASTPAPAAAAGGKAVWAEHGCGSCHTFAAASATAVFGPNLTATLKGMPASYIRESIVAPSKVAAAGFSTGMMPEDYGARMSPAELDRLVDFIRSGVPD